jgi:5-methyltetrahydrofolate--homocysteine methyltransferase
MQAMFPLVAQYGTAVFLMLTEQNGIPETVDDRLRIAEKLIKSAQDHGIPLEDLVVDPVVVAASTVPGFMSIYLQSVEAIRREFECSVILAGSNAGFGMPSPGLIDQAFMMAAMAAGVDMVLASYEAPEIPVIFATVKAMDFLSGRDPNGKSYIRAYRKNKAQFPE